MTVVEEAVSILKTAQNKLHDVLKESTRTLLDGGFKINECDNSLRVAILDELTTGKERDNDDGRE